MRGVRLERALSISIFVAVEDVIRALGCSLALPYEHLRRAARRRPGLCGLLRVPVRAWERYVEEVFVRK